MDQKELTFEESLRQVMQTLPPVIRNYLSQGKYTPVAVNLTKKYGLRVDQAGILEREIMLLLMGVENPTEFAEALATEAQIDQKTITDLSRDLNDQIFVPLRAEEESKGLNAEQSAKPAAPQPVKLSPTYVPPQRPIAQNVVVAPVIPRPAATLGDVVRSVTSAPNRTLEDHEEPHIVFNRTPTAPAVAAPRVVPSVPANLPGAMPFTPAAIVTDNAVRPSTLNRLSPDFQPAAPRPVFQSATAPIAPAPVVAPRPAPAPVAPTAPTLAPLPSYSSDPYREPVDEPPAA